MELSDLASRITALDAAAPRKKIQLFAWFLHTYAGKETCTNEDIRMCFSTLHMADPNVAKYLSRMIQYGDLISLREGFKLERKIRTALDAKYGTHHSTVQVSKLLIDLPSKVPDLAEKHFLTEALKCYRVEAFRACVVMAWNLAYAHLLYWILNDAGRLKNFNIAITQRYPKKMGIQITGYDDFTDKLKESEIIEVCKTASLINGNVAKILKEKLDKRNTAAHPASVVIVQSQADDVVTDLVNNVVLNLV